MAICVYYRCWPRVISGPGYFGCWGPDTILDLRTSSCDIVVTFFLHSECLPSVVSQLLPYLLLLLPSSFTPPSSTPAIPTALSYRGGAHRFRNTFKFRVQRGQVDHRFFTQCIVEELVKIYLLGIARAHISSVGRCR